MVNEMQSGWRGGQGTPIFQLPATAAYGMPILLSQVKTVKSLWDTDISKDWDQEGGADKVPSVLQGQLYLTRDTEHNHAVLPRLSSSGHTLLHCLVKEVTAGELLLLKFSEAGIPMSLL